MKKFGRKVLALLLCLTMTAGMAALPVGALETADVPVGAYVEGEAIGGTFGDFTYRVNDDGVTITTYTGSDAEVDIPKEIDGKAVIRIGNNAFEKCTSLTSIAIPDSVTNIGNQAFRDCTSLTSITIPNSVTSIGGAAFAYCTLLTSIAIPDSVTNIGDFAFGFCTSLTSITIPDSVTNIGYQAFENCTSLTSITIPDSVTNIGDFAFWRCTSLTSITIPDSVTNIGSYAFDDCTSLTSIKVGSGNNNFSSIDGILYDKSIKKLFSCPAGKTSVTIPDSVTSIGESAFCGCTSLTSITIPDSVTSIGRNAFYYCTSLTSINVGSGNNNYSSIDGILYDKSIKTLFSCPAEKTNITIPDSVTSIVGAAFAYCTLLTSIAIPDSVTNIGDFAFGFCTSLTSITIPDSVTNIGIEAFENCASLTSITIPDSVTNIGRYAFLDCTSLTSITIPDSVTNIGKFAFVNCTSLTSITIPDSVTNIGIRAFDNCTSLTSINVVSGNNNYSSIDGILYDKSIKKLFSCPAGKTSVKIPDSVTSIGESAFQGCTSLKSVIIPNSVTSIGESAFDGCTSLKSVTIPDSVTSIGNGAFYGCSSLTSVTIPNSVTSIDYYAFYICENLKDVYYTGTQEQWKKIIIRRYNDCLNNATIHYNSHMPQIVEKKKAARLEINAPSTIEIGEEQTLTVTPYDKDGNKLTTDDVQLTYSFSNSGVVSVIEKTNGYVKVKGAKAGETTLTVTDEKSGKSVIRLIKVTESLFDYTVLSNGTIEITKYNGTDSNVTVPSTIDGKNVSKLGNRTFANCITLQSVTIPNTVTSIGDYVFNYCSSLQNITIPNSVTTIGLRPFSDCTGLNSINVNANNKSFSSKDGILYNKDQTTLVCCPGGKTNITIPNTVTKVAANAFWSCSNLKSITISDSVTTIGDYAFFYCTGLTSINVNSKNNSFSSVDGVLYSKDKKTLICCPEGKTGITIPNTVNTIGDNAFYYCTKMKSVTIPGSVTKIGSSVFYKCTSMESITIPDSITTIGSKSFNKCTSLTDVYYTGSQEQWKKISIGANNDSLSSDTVTIHYNSEHNPNLYNNFMIGRDNNSYFHTNKEKYYDGTPIDNPGFVGRTDHSFTNIQYYNVLTNGASYGIKKKINKKMIEEWHGSCYGVALSIALVNQGYVDISDITNTYAANHFDLNPRLDRDKKYSNMIEYYYLSQYLKNGGSSVIE